MQLCTVQLSRMSKCTVEPPIMDTSKSRQPPYDGQTVCPCLYAFLTREGTTSEQWTNCSSPMCPLFSFHCIPAVCHGLYRQSSRQSSTYIYVVFEVSLLYVEENGGLVKVPQVCHVFHCIDTALVHRHYVVRGQGRSR